MHKTRELAKQQYDTNKQKLKINNIDIERMVAEAEN